MGLSPTPKGFWQHTLMAARGGGGERQHGSNHAGMRVSKSEGYGSLIGFKLMK